jgi:hypothetical protein
MFCRLLFVPLSFFFWPLYCLTFFDWRLLITYHFSIFKLFLNSVIVLNSSKFRSRILQCKKEDIIGRHINLKTILKIPNGCVIRSVNQRRLDITKWQVSLVVQYLLTLTGHLNSLPVFVVRLVVFCLVFCRSVFVLLPFFFWPLYYLSFNLRLLNYPFVIFKLYPVYALLLFTSSFISFLII